MLILLPISAFAAAFVVLVGESEAEEPDIVALGRSFLRAAALWGAFVTVSSEILSLFGAITRLWLGLAWFAALLGVVYAGWKRNSLHGGWQRLRGLSLPLGRGERWIVSGIAGLAGALLVVAWISPPNNVDSLLYHMARVVHWAQDQSLRHYATARDHQLLKPIWAETAILHLRILWGSDRPATLVQWFSLGGSLVGTVGLAAMLGANRTGRLLTAAFVVSIPMGVLQATSTQNDFVVAIWAVCAAFFVVRAAHKPPPMLDRVCLALTLGIGFLAKGTYYVYAPLFMIWYFLIRWRQAGFRKMAVEAMAMGALAVALNLGFWARNMATFGGPYGTSDWLQRNLWIRFPSAEAPPQSVAGGGEISPEAGAEEAVDLPAPGVATNPLVRFVARALRTAAFNLVTPVGRINEGILGVMRRAPALFDEGYVGQWSMVAWNHEDTAPNTIHLALIVMSAALVMAGRNQTSRSARLFVLVVLGTYLLIPVVIGHGPSVWGMRYQLPFFVLAGPIVGVAGSRPQWRVASGWLSAGLLLLALPWLVLNNTRPLVGWTPWPTRTESILTTSSTEIMFASNPRLRSSYVEGTDIVRSSGCTQVGLRIDSDDLEHIMWWLLDAPQSGIRLETIYTTERLIPLIDPAFRPCAILCTVCRDRQRLHGLPLVADLDRLDVFLGPGYVTDPDG